MKNSKQTLQTAKSIRRSRPQVDPRVEKRLAAEVQHNLRRAVIKDELDRLFDLIRNESKALDFRKVIKVVESACKELQKGELTRDEKDRLGVVLYTVHRADADMAFERGQAKRARDSYLRAIDRTPANVLREYNRRCANYAGAGVMSASLKNYGQALEFYEKSAQALLTKEKYCLPNLKYLAGCLHHISSFLTTPSQKKKFAEVVDIVRRKMKIVDQSFAPSVPPERRKHYVKHGITIKDPFAYFEHNGDQMLKDWLSSHDHHYTIKSLIMTLDLKPQVDYYAAAYAQLYSVPYKVSGHYYFHKRDRSTSHTVISRSPTLKGRPEEVFSAASVCERDEWFEGLRVQENGNFLAYGVSRRGSDIETWTVRNMKTGRDLKKHKLQVANGWIMFHPDGKGLVYRKVARKSKDSPLAVYGKQQSIFYHSFRGKKQRDRCVYTPTANARWVGADYAFDGDVLVISEWLHHSHDNHVIIKAASKGKRKQIRLFRHQPGNHRYVGEIGDELFFLTNHQAPNRKVVAVEIDRKNLEVVSTRVIVPQSESHIKRAYCLDNTVLLEYMNKSSGRTVLIETNLDGKQKRVKLPIEGTLSGISHTKSSGEILFSMSNFGTPSIIYRMNLKTNKTSVLFAPTFKSGMKIIEEVVKVPSKDGTEIPMLIARLSSVKPGPRTPVQMHVYGGFGVSMQSSSFSYDSLCWFAMGGMLAMPYLRGGSELGENWHRQATKLNKQRTFDDAIACAEWLIDNRYTSAKKLAITGGSNGGLTVAAAITQRPELFGAAIGNNGLYDMLRFESHTIGWAWASEYGTTRRKDEFLTLRKYSPYHNLGSKRLPESVNRGKRSRQKVKGSFPKILLNVDADDDRVAPWHTYKFAAALQKRYGGITDILLRVESKRGHGNSRPSNRLIEELAFLQWALDMRSGK